MKQFCEYELVSLRTSFVLLTGCKIKDFDKANEMYDKLCTFRETLFGKNKITCFCKPVVVKQQPCVLVYYVHSQTPPLNAKDITTSTVTSAGQLLNLSGKEFTYLFDMSPDIIKALKQKKISWYNVWRYLEENDGNDKFFRTV